MSLRPASSGVHGTGPMVGLLSVAWEQRTGGEESHVEDSAHPTAK